MSKLPRNCLRFGAVSAAALLLSCAHHPYAVTNKQYRQQAKTYAATLRADPEKTGFDSIKEAPDWTGTINFNMRKPNFVIIHHTAQNSCAQTLQTFTTTKSQVSAHYVICKDGTVHHMLNDYLRAWQAGISRWGNVTDVNSVSIGIEIDNNGFEAFTDEQINSLLHLLQGLKKTYGIPAANFIGHADIAPTRKNDPNVHFPWKLLADKGYGLWYGDTTNINTPPDFNNLQALRIIGYDVRDSSAAIAAFKRHFLQQDSSKVLLDGDRKILYLLEQKYQ